MEWVLFAVVVGIFALVIIENRKKVKEQRPSKGGTKGDTEIK